jgi:hypothetical protein
MKSENPIPPGDFSEYLFLSWPCAERTVPPRVASSAVAATITKAAKCLTAARGKLHRLGDDDTADIAFSFSENEQAFCAAFDLLNLFRSLCMQLTDAVRVTDLAQRRALHDSWQLCPDSRYAG